jgi:hypothetical protein
MPCINQVKTAQRKTVTAKIEHLAGCVIPQAVPLERERLHAVPYTPEIYDELYDFKTLFYDAFYTASRGTVTLIAPKLLNLQKIISSGTFQFDDVTVSNKRLHKAFRFDRLVFRTGFRPQVMRLNWQDLELSMPVRDDGSKEFAGLNCLATVSRNNRLQWIEDWAAYHVHRQGVEAILFFDNGSDAYSPADIADTLSGIDGLKTFKVVSVPFKYGPHVRIIWRRAKFLQTALFNLARLSYLRESAATLNIDIDELVQTTGGKTVFDYTIGSLLGYTRFKGRHRYAISAKQQDVIRHKDHLHINPDDASKKGKYCIVPSGPLRFFNWTVHGLYIYPFDRYSFHRCVGFDHFYSISTNWKNDRSQPVYGKNYVEEKFFSGSDC